MVPSTEPNARQYSVWLRLPPSALCKLWKSREFFIETFPSPCGNPCLSRVSTGGAVCIALSVGFFTHYKPEIPLYIDGKSLREAGSEFAGEGAGEDVVKKVLW